MHAALSAVSPTPSLSAGPGVPTSAHTERNIEPRESCGCMGAASQIDGSVRPPRVPQMLVRICVGEDPLPLGEVRASFLALI